MARLTGVRGPSSAGDVFKVLGRLTEAGYTERVEWRIAPTKRSFTRPVLGLVHAGLPQLESQVAPYDTLSVEDGLRKLERERASIDALDQEIGADIPTHLRHEKCHLPVRQLKFLPPPSDGQPSVHKEEVGGFHR